MIVEPKTRGFICTTAHPVGCKANVQRQVDYMKARPMVDGPKKVLVIGCSTGYGLSSRIAAAFACGADTLGVMFEKPAHGSRTASAGWYNTAAFEELAQQEGRYAKTINGDAFSQEVKQQVIDRIQQDLGKIDMVIYSLAAPRRTTADGSTYSSVLKTTGAPYTNKTIDLKTEAVSEVTIEPATEEEIDHTIKVMGGEDWRDWIAALDAAGVLDDHTLTVAYSYIGPSLTHPIYRDGSIGKAKEHLHRTALQLNQEFPKVAAFISVNKALVTQSSAAIPIVPLYISILYKVMKEQGLHEGCCEQMYRLFHEKLYGDKPMLDSQNLVRLDDWEMRDSVQQAVTEVWNRIETATVPALADLAGYWEDFYQMFGFRLPGVDYQADVDTEVSIPSIS